jgi:tyrosine-protein kinase Etk/Wzc
MVGLLAKARTRYDAIVIDTPPVLAASEAMSLAARADRTLVVVRSETTPRKALLIALKELRAISDRPLGLVLNGVRLRRHGQYGDSGHLAYYRTCVQYLKS